MFHKQLWTLIKMTVPTTIQPLTTQAYNYWAEVEARRRPDRYDDATPLSLHKVIRAIYAIAVTIFVVPAGALYHFSSSAYYALCSRIRHFSTNVYQGKANAHFHCARLDISTWLPSLQPGRVLVTHPNILPRHLPATQRLASFIYSPPRKDPTECGDAVTRIRQAVNRHHQHVITPENATQLKSYLNSLPSVIKNAVVNSLLQISEHSRDVAHSDPCLNVPLIIALMKQDMELLKVLVECGARNFIYNWYNQGSVFGEITGRGRCWGSQTSLVPFVEYLLQEGASPIVPLYQSNYASPNKRRYEPILARICATCSFNDEDKARALQSLINYAVNPNILIDQENPREGTTALFTAVSNGLPQATNVLLTAGADITKAFGNEHEAWKAAVNYGSAPLVRRLIENGYDVHTIDEHGLTALHWAKALHYQQLEKLLLEHGVDPDQQSTKPYEMIIELTSGNTIHKKTKIIPAGLDYVEFAKHYNRIAALGVLCNDEYSYPLRYRDSQQHELSYDNIHDALNFIVEVDDPLPNGETLLFRALKKDTESLLSDSRYAELLLDKGASMLTLNGYHPISLIERHIVWLKKQEVDLPWISNAPSAQRSELEAEHKAIYSQVPLPPSDYPKASFNNFSIYILKKDTELHQIDYDAHRQNSPKVFALIEKARSVAAKQLQVYIGPNFPLPLARMICEYLEGEDHREKEAASIKEISSKELEEGLGLIVD